MVLPTLTNRRNTATGETSWERPTARAATAATATAAAAKAEAAKPEEKKEEGGGDSNNNGLPPGWKEVKHAATGQVCACVYCCLCFLWGGGAVNDLWVSTHTYTHTCKHKPIHASLPTHKTLYLHEATGTKRWDRPTSAEDVSSDIQARQQQHAAQAAQAAQAAKLAKQQGLGKRPRGQEVDPLDPTGGRGGNGQRGLNGAADSTASGALWQVRPVDWAGWAGWAGVCLSVYTN